VTGTGSFVATNLDDLLVLMVLFARADRQTNDRQILLGRYLGFGAIILASLVGFWGGLFLPPWVIGLLGFGPIAIGISQLRDRKANQSNHAFPLETQTLTDSWDQLSPRSPQKPN
jgi:cadmium resistance protein CadD (predicted permease)